VSFVAFTPIDTTIYLFVAGSTPATSVYKSLSCKGIAAFSLICWQLSTQNLREFAIFFNIGVDITFRPWYIVVTEERDMIKEEKVAWTASNNSSYLVGEREASTVLAAVRAARSYIRYELYGEGKATISVNGVPVRTDERSIFTGFRWVVTDLTE
jgi:hypothetical protein